MACTREQETEPKKVTPAANSHTHPDQHDNNLPTILDRPGPRYLSALSSSISGSGFERGNGNIRPSQIPTMTPAFQFQIDPASSDTTAPATKPQVEPVEHNDGLLQVSKPKRPYLMTRVSWAAAEVWDNHINELNFPRCMYHLVSSIWLCLMLYLAWWLLPIQGHWTTTRQSDRVPHQAVDLSK